MSNGGARVVRAKTFDDALDALASSHPSARAAADAFCDALKIAGEHLPAQSPSGDTRSHYIDDPGFGAEGKRIYCVMWHVAPSTPTSQCQLTLLDIWRR